MVTGGCKLGLIHFKASVDSEPNKPPTTGWKFFNMDTSEFVADPSLICSAASNSPPCCLTVELSGPAKEAQGKCEGEYRSTGLVSAGRPVIIILKLII